MRVIEYLAEGTYRPHLTIVRGRWKLAVCPGDPDQLFDLSTDPHELRNRAGDADCADVITELRGVLADRYDLPELERRVLESQRDRRLVATSLQTGRMRHWDFVPDPEEGYVRGNFWAAFRYAKIPEETG